MTPEVKVKHTELVKELMEASERIGDAAVSGDLNMWRKRVRQYREIDDKIWELKKANPELMEGENA